MSSAPYDQHVALLRNVNQGQRGHPATAELRAAFTAAGALEVTPFQSNGTIVFTSSDGDGVAVRAQDELEARAIFTGLIVTRPLAFIEEIVERNSDAGDAQRRELTLFSPALRIEDAAAARPIAAHRRCEILAHGPGWAVLLNEREKESNGTPSIEAILQTPATSRGLPTLVRLVDRFGRSNRSDR